MARTFLPVCGVTNEDARPCRCGGVHLGDRRDVGGVARASGRSVRAYQKLQPADYRLLHSDALGFVTAKAHEGFELHARYAGVMSFEIRCKGVLVMEVENAPSRVLIRMPADARWRAPDIERLRISFERWLDLHQSQGRLLVESAGPSWVEARFGRFNGLVLDEQRCLLGAPAHRQADPTNDFSAEVPS